jgi:hypothetical protein
MLVCLSFRLIRLVQTYTVKFIINKLLVNETLYTKNFLFGTMTFLMKNIYICRNIHLYYEILLYKLFYSNIIYNYTIWIIWTHPWDIFIFIFLFQIRAITNSKPKNCRSKKAMSVGYSNDVYFYFFILYLYRFTLRYLNQ